MVKQQESGLLETARLHNPLRPLFALPKNHEILKQCHRSEQSGQL